MKLSILVLVGVAAVALAGCQMTITDRYEIGKDGSVKIRMIEALDDQMAQLASGNGARSWENPFSVSADGPWTLTRSVDAAGTHIVETSRTVRGISDVPGAVRDLFGTASLSQGSPTTSLDSAVQSLTSTMSVTNAGIFHLQQHLHVDVPALMPPQEQSSSNPWALAGSAMAASMISVRTEIMAPVEIVGTNGERLSDGSYRWTHALQSPTTIDITTETPNVTNIIVAVVVGVVLLSTAALLGWRISMVRRTQRATTG